MFIKKNTAISPTRRTSCLRVVLTIATLPLFATVAQAEADGAYPSRPITTILPLQAGSAGDSLIRVVTKRMAENMGQSIIIDNRPGVSGALGATGVARAEPDGYTLGGMSDSVVNYAPNLVKVNFDPLTDFEPISKIGDVEWVLVANTEIPVTSVAELRAWVQGQEKGKVDYASAGVGSPHQVVMELFSAKTGMSLTHVPYNGATAALLDVVGGTVPVMFTAISVALPFIQGGKLRALAVPSQNRSSLMPDTSTMAEAGVDDFAFATWLGLYAPRGTPEPILDRLNAEVVKALEGADVRKQLLDMGATPSSTSRGEFARITEQGLKTVADVVAAAGIPTNR